MLTFDTFQSMYLRYMLIVHIRIPHLCITNFHVVYGFYKVWNGNLHFELSAISNILWCEFFSSQTNNSTQTPSSDLNFKSSPKFRSPPCGNGLVGYLKSFTL